MHPDQLGATNGGSPSTARSVVKRSELETLGATLDVPLPLDARAPGAARIVVTACLRARVPASVLDDAQLVASELVSNSVRHSRASPASVVVVRMQLTDAFVRLEVADSGRSGAIAPRPADLVGGGGLGLNLVESLSERWGLERVVASGTRVWALLPRAPAVAGSGPGRNGRRDATRRMTRSAARAPGAR
jgi:anti-sigma regulatory factor (Ser/Thr protein kinase)